MSRWIWVVEVVDGELRRRNKPCELAEAIIDATDQLRDIHALSWRVPGLMASGAPYRHFHIEAWTPYPPYAQ